MPYFTSRPVCCLLFIAGIILIYSCQSVEEDGFPSYAEWDCDANTGHVLIREWSDLVLLGGGSLCLDTLCMYFNLTLREDSTYQWDYLLFEDAFDPVYIAENHDSGTYDFLCNKTGYFTTALTYYFVDGALLLNSNAGTQDTLSINWDGFYGLQFNSSAFDPKLNLGTFVLPN